MPLRVKRHRLVVIQKFFAHEKEGSRRFHAANFKQERFGRQRIKEAFLKGGASAEVVAQNMLWEMRRFVGLTERTDDVTMIVAKML